MLYGRFDDSTVPNADHSFWQKLLKIKAPPKVINLLWRAAVNCLPTKQRLVQKHIFSDDLCLGCGQEREYVLHALVTCGLTREVWVLSGVGWFLGNSTNFLDWLDLIFSKISRKKWGEMAVLCWSLWHSRSDLMWNGKRKGASHIIQQGFNLLSC